ncbi:MAG TPA: hypothetical protein VNT31_09880 [Nocardioides sp.]|nr:hypothetical protein [Nocardioides sp.]
MTSRILAASGAAFVVLALAGNSLTESAVSAVDPGGELDGEQAAANLAAYAGSTAARVGLGLEILGMAALAVFAAAVTTRLVGRAPAAAITAAIGAAGVLLVKLATGAPLLAGIAEHERLSDDAALALMATNGAGFVLSWVPMAVLVGALAAGLAIAGEVGRPTAVVGGVLAALGVVAALVGAGDVNGAAVPIPFLLSLLWVAVVSVRLAIGTRRSERVLPVAAARSGSAHR